MYPMHPSPRARLQVHSGPSRLAMGRNMKLIQPGTDGLPKHHVMMAASSTSNVVSRTLRMSFISITKIDIDINFGLFIDTT